MAEGFEVIGAEAIPGNARLEHCLELAAGFVPETIANRHGGEGMGQSVAQGGGCLGQIIMGDGAVGAAEAFGGFGSVEPDSSH